MHRSIILALACTVVACEPAREPAAPAEMSHAHGGGAYNLTGIASNLPGRLNPDIERQVARLRTLTAPFQKFEAAARAGWGAQITACFSDPQGGMGFHYGNTALIDGVVDIDKPELLLYEPLANGGFRFVAVEYIVPFTAWTAAQPPKLYGQSYHRNEAFGLWVLHVWHFRENPSGIFADWNPRVSCQYATS
jgi:hypothetical protein